MLYDATSSVSLLIYKSNGIGVLVVSSVYRIIDAILDDSLTLNDNFQDLEVMSCYTR